MSADRPDAGPEGPDAGFGPGMGEAAEREVEGWLRSVEPRPPRPGFRAALRASFVAGDLAQGAQGTPDGASPTARDGRSSARMIEDLLRAGDPPPPPRAAFRDGLRERFVRGELRERARPAAGAAGGSGRGPATGPLLRLVVGGLAAAAALWLVARLLVPDAPAWRGFRAEGAGPVVVDGRELVPRDLAKLGGAFAAGRVLESRGRRLELVRDDDLVLALLPGTELETVADGADGELRFALRRGEIYLKTHAGYRGPAVVVETDDMDMRMTGTVVGVLKMDALSCICVARGSVDVTPRAVGEARVCRGDVRHVVHSSGEEEVAALSEGAEASSAHVMDLLEFADAAF